MYSDSESISSNITRLSKYSGPKLMFECPDLDNYRTNVKKIQDPKVHLNFAKQLIHVGKEMSKDSEMDKARLKKNQDILNKEALFWIKKAASDSKFFKLGDPDALFMLADCYGTGELGVAIDNQRAFELYKKAAKQSHYDSIYRVAVCYEVGAGVRPNQSKAFQMYRKAAVAKNTAAMYKMGLVLLDGLLGQAKNPREAINWIREAARQADESNPEPLHQLGLLFLGKDPELSKHLVPVHEAKLGSNIFI
jgi:TPR repeat protein